MPDIVKDFQDKYHPCSKCVVRICCSEKCDLLFDYIDIVYPVLKEYFRPESSKFQFCLSKLYYFNVSDYQAKRKILLRPIKSIRELSSKNEMFTIITKAIIKKIEGCNT